MESTARIPGLIGQVLGTLSAATLEGALGRPHAERATQQNAPSGPRAQGG